MEIELQLPNTTKKVRIPLTKTAPLDDAVVTVTGDGVSRTFSGRQAQHGDHAHYRNIDRKAVLSVRHENDVKRISGHVTHEDALYFIQPIGDSGHRVSKSNGTDSQTDGPQFERVLSRKKRRVNGEATDYQVEIHILIDHTVWKTFKTIFGTDDKALTELHFYYSHIVIGMDTIFRNIGRPSISVRCIGLTLAKTEADAKWMPPDNSADARDGITILSSIIAYMYAKGSRADHVMGFTRRDIGADGNSGPAGMAYIRGACGQWKVSIVEDLGLHSWGAAAHELAHNLGARHDKNEPGCESLGNLMCAKLYCYKTGGSMATTYGGLRAPVGTPCGSQKSCNWNGQCTYDSQVPVIDMSCFFGDNASAEQCNSFYQKIAEAWSAETKSYYCSQVKSECCKTLALICSCHRTLNLGLIPKLTIKCLTEVK
uniref:ADAM_CR_2 domain-containing protein n=1 Tax=Macrostomum lignano TaxID=282301 RepID=A0A1I8H5H7_9PLAT